MVLNTHDIPLTVRAKVTLVIMAFAGVKFKTGHCTSGRQYLDFTESILRKTLEQFPKVSELIICEEKYSYTKDDFKCAAWEQRKSKSTALRGPQPLLSIGKQHTLYSVILLLIKTAWQRKFKQAVTAKRTFRHNSEFINETCKCSAQCTCTQEAIIICKIFHEVQPPEKSIKLAAIKQCKGETEMS